jgi:hypothetical protein
MPGGAELWPYVIRNECDGSEGLMIRKEVQILAVDSLRYIEALPRRCLRSAMQGVFEDNPQQERNWNERGICELFAVRLEPRE